MFLSRKIDDKYRKALSYKNKVGEGFLIILAGSIEPKS